MIAQADRIRSQLLVLRYRRGDNGAFGELVSLWEKPLYYYIRRLVKTEEDAWDVMQNAWIRVMRGIGKLKNLESLPSWLYRIARNAAYNYIRDNSEPTTVTGDDVFQEIADPVAENDFSNENADAIHRGLDRLPAIQREVLTLFFLEEFSITEIADITGVPPGTVKSRLYYAKKALKAIMNEGGLRDV